jgi:hypothetical protein
LIRRGLPQLAVAGEGRPAGRLQMESSLMILVPQFLRKKLQSGLCSLAATSREHYFISLAMCCPAKSLRILHEISEQIGVMGDRHRQECVASINHHLGKNDDFPGLELDDRTPEYETSESEILRECPASRTLPLPQVAQRPLTRAVARSRKPSHRHPRAFHPVRRP